MLTKEQEIVRLHHQSLDMREQLTCLIEKFSDDGMGPCDIIAELELAKVRYGNFRGALAIAKLYGLKEVDQDSVKKQETDKPGPE